MKYIVNFENSKHYFQSFQTIFKIIKEIFKTFEMFN
nr:MAG TPA: hypothetical protein [Caudoviricetes sp.]